jgi:hypothetical protein
MIRRSGYRTKLLFKLVNVYPPPPCHHQSDRLMVLRLTERSTLLPSWIEPNWTIHTYYRAAFLSNLLRIHPSLFFEVAARLLKVDRRARRRLLLNLLPLLLVLSRLLQNLQPRHQNVVADRNLLFFSKQRTANYHLNLNHRGWSRR